jgi:hypothetical protein
LAKEHSSNDNSGESLEDKIRKACIVYEQSALGPSPSAVALANAASIASLRATDFLANEKKKLKATSRAAETLKSKLYSRKSRVSFADLQTHVGPTKRKLTAMFMNRSCKPEKPS